MEYELSGSSLEVRKYEYVVIYKHMYYMYYVHKIYAKEVEHGQKRPLDANLAVSRTESVK